MAEPDDFSEPLPTQPWSGPQSSPSPVTPSHASAAGRHVGWQPPEPEELQASFPLYEIRGILGRGGMGAVYQGWQKSLDRLVAIKILPPDLEDHGANFAERFQREAKAMARFSHPGIVAVYDAGETPNGLFYFVMEYIEGTDVQKMVRENGPLPPEHALAITAHVCDALAYAHKRGVIHRDIKPANIMVDTEGQVKVADFGLAKVANDDSAALVTGTHVSMGTADFMAPEALYGMGHVDHRADLYAVGVMLYQMLTGEVPRGLFEMPSKHREGIDPRFDEIVKHAMQKDPEKRYASATEIRTDLDKILSEPVPHRSAVESAPPPTAPPQASVKAEARPAKAAAVVKKSAASGGSKRWVWLTSGIAATVLVLAGGAAFFQGKTKAPSDEIERTKQMIPPLEVTPAVALEPGAIRLWDTPEKVPTGDPRVSWKDGALFLNGYNQAGKVGDRVLSHRDSLVRFSLRMNRDARGASLVVRDSGTAAVPREYRLSISPVDQRIEFIDGTGNPWKTLKRWPWPRTYTDDEWMRVELRSVADEFSVSIDGKLLETFRDSALLTGGMVRFGGAANCYFRDIVYVPLDPPGSSKATSAPTKDGIDVRTFAGHRYQMVTTRAPWSEAKARAETMGGHLATITSQAEHDWIKETFARSLTDPKVWFWLGGYASVKDEWNLVTRESIALVPWAAGHPGYREPNAYPAAMSFQWRENGNRITAQGAQYPMPFLVEWDDATSAPPAVSLSPAAEPWHDWLAEQVAAGTLPNTFTPAPGGGYYAGSTQLGPKMRDQAVRATFRPDNPRGALGLQVRADAGNLYRLMCNFTSHLEYARPNQPPEALAVFDNLPPSKRPATDRDVTMELRVVGDQLTVRVNGEIVASARHAALREGTPMLSSAPGWIVKKVEVLNLDTAASTSQATPPVTSASAPKPLQTLDLLTLVSPTEDRIHAPGYTEANRWTKSPGKLVYESDGKMGKLVPPVAMNTRDYEIEFTFRRTVSRGGERLILDLPIDAAPTSLPLILNSPGEKFIHNQQGDLWPGPKRDSGTFIVRCKMGRASGEADHVIVSLDGKTLTDWHGSLRASSKATEAHPSFPRQLLTSLVCRRDSYEFTKWELRVFEGEAKVLRNPPASAADAPSAAATKDTPFVNSLGMKFVPVPIAGGPTDGQRVLFSVWETRVQDYEVFAKETKREWPKPEFEQGPTHPAVFLNWDDARAFCAWLTAKEVNAGKLAATERYRLPTDHEWSCAAGIGDRESPSISPLDKSLKIADVYPWGTVWPIPAGVENVADISAKMAVVRNDGNYLQMNDGFAYTAPVGTYRSNALGLYDLGGNVSEWCEDQVKNEGTRVFRGSSFGEFYREMLLASRRGDMARIKRERSPGFRVVLASAP